MTVKINGVELMDATVAYLTTALWAETVSLPCIEEDLSDGFIDVDEDHVLHNIQECSPLDEHFDIDDFTEEALSKADSEVGDWFDYLEDNDLYGRACEYADDDQIAHDFWLTRNGHGAGYWDGDYGDDNLGDVLSRACKAWGGQHVWISEDGKLSLDDC